MNLTILYISQKHCDVSLVSLVQSVTYSVAFYFSNCGTNLELIN